METLRTQQAEMARALLEPERDVPTGLAAGGVQRRFAIYRNNVVVSLTEALGTRFPVCRALVGPEFFDATACIFVRERPPRSPLLMTYGDDFGEFLDAFPPAGAVPYLADIARLEAARTRAYHAADRTPLSIDEIETLDPALWSRTSARIHPSAEIVRSEYPIASIWHHHVEPRAVSFDRIDGEDVLIARPFHEVELRVLPPGAATFITRLSDSATFEIAAREASEEPDFDLVACLACVLSSRILVATSTRER